MTVRSDPRRPLRASPAWVVLLLLAALVAACGASVATPSGSLAPSPSAVASVPAESGGASAPASGEPTLAPGATPWPGGVVEAVTLLAKADLGIQEAGADLGAAAAYEDLAAMWGAADGLASLVERIQTQVPRIAGYPATASAADAYAAAFPDMLAGAKVLRDAIKAADAAGITAGSQQLAAGLEKYAAARRLIGPLADQAIPMQRILSK